MDSSQGCELLEPVDAASLAQSPPLSPRSSLTFQDTRRCHECPAAHR
ncbi:MAG: hypothetical protein ACRDNZ_00220 [Streptosporangiaceae bacterium]